MNGPVEVTPWEPPVFLGRLQHGFANLLVPLVVGAELLDDGSEVSAGLSRGVERMRRASERVKRLGELSAPSVEPLSVGELADRLGLDVADPAGRVAVDAVRLRRHVVEEMLDNGACLSLRACPARGFVVLRSSLTDARIAEQLAPWAAVPLVLSPGGVGVALACREVHLHAGHVQVSDEGIDFLLPLAKG